MNETDKINDQALTDALAIVKLRAALSVMVLDKRTRAFLEDNDPQALKQALDALDVESVEELEKQTLTAWLAETPSILKPHPSIAGFACAVCGLGYATSDDAAKCASSFHAEAP